MQVAFEVAWPIPVGPSITDFGYYPHGIKAQFQGVGLSHKWMTSDFEYSSHQLMDENKRWDEVWV